MIKKLFLVLLFFLLPTLASSTRLIEDFSAQDPGGLPKRFRTFPFQRGKAARVYQVQKEKDNLYLAAEDREGISIQIMRKFPWDIRQMPILSWRWRARLLPDGADESVREKNDSACGVYVVFGGYGGRVLKYVWSSTRPAGAVFRKGTDDFFFVVKNSGPSPGWRNVTVNVWDDYRKVFTEEPTKNPIGFGILTDGNATHTPAACDYDDFEVADR